MPFFGNILLILLSNYVAMNYTAFIDLNTLTDEAKKELKSFYEYLTFKYPKKIEKKISEESKKEQFFRFIEKHSYNLPEDYKVNREELHER
ncbi:MAG: hypothetical protein B6D64_09665 [Bacteroidetes bacterium 4484_276]|nr:MAG: hypothetical protein B6D64_09665 [Bacteroidetes bacterium 4484_276]